MTKRNTNRTRAARATVQLILSNGGGLLYLLLATRTAPFSQAREAHRLLARVIEERVRAYVHTHLAALASAVPSATVIEAMVASATARVIAALPRCASRSPNDLARWLDRQIADAVDGDDDGDPHGGPATPAPMVDPASAWGLHRLPIPRAEREALVAAVLSELTSRERWIIEAMADPQASWTDAAQALGLSLFETKRLYEHANTRAHEIAVKIAMRATEAVDELHTKKAA